MSPRRRALAIISLMMQQTARVAFLLHGERTVKTDALGIQDPQPCVQEMDNVDGI